MAGDKGDIVYKRIDDEIIEKINDDINIVNIISEYVQLKKTGANYVGLCPFHNEKTPSFTVSESKNIFHCFGCGESGNAIKFIMKKENLDFTSAIVYLGEKLGIEIQEGFKPDQKTIDEKTKTYEINKEAAKYFYNNLKVNKQALGYLNRRKISIKVLNQFGLGFAIDSWESLYNFLKNKYSDEEIFRAGLINKRNDGGYYDKFRNRVIFPIIDTKSRVIGFGGRVLDDSMPKYLNSPDTNVFSKGNHLYGLNLLNKFSNRKRILLVEGYMDVISLYNNGINYSVASLGTALTSRQAQLIKRYGDEIYICYDSDSAGIKATIRAIDIMLKEGVKPRIISLPKGLDPDDYIKEKGLAEFEKIFSQSLNHIEFKVQTIKEKYNLSNVEEKVEFTRAVASILKSLTSPIEQDAYMEKIADESGISREAIEREVRGSSINQYKSNKSKPIKKDIEPINTKLPSAGLKAEIDLIRLMIEEKDHFENITSKLNIDDFECIECKYVYNLLKLMYKEKDLIDEEVFFNEILEIPNLDRSLINTIFTKDFDYQPTNINQVINELINTVMFVNVMNKKKDLLIKIEELDKKENRNPDDDQLLKKLMWDLIEINKELNPNN